MKFLTRHPTSVLAAATMFLTMAGLASARADNGPVDVTITDKGCEPNALTVPPGKYFMMGDNRDNSYDSRWFGFVDREAIVGRATAVALSVDLKHHWIPRWKRFFSKLS